MTNNHIADVLVRLPSQCTLAAQLTLANKFFEFCHDKGVYEGQNPVARYLKEIGKPCSQSKRTIYREASTHLTEETEDRLQCLILKQLLTPDLEQDDFILSPALILGANMSIDRLLELTWSEIQFFDSYVVIQDTNTTVCSTTHNFTRPPLQRTSDLLIKKYRNLRSKLSAGALADRHVIYFSERSARQNLKTRKAMLTAFVHHILQQAGVGDADFLKCNGGKACTESGGAGMKLLQGHYKYALKQCGLEIDSGLGQFSLGKAIQSVSFDSYYSATGPDGERHMAHYMARDNKYSPHAADTLQTELPAPNHIVIRLPAFGPNKITQGVWKLPEGIRLPAGTVISVRSPYGTKLSFLLVKDPDQAPTFTLHGY